MRPFGCMFRQSDETFRLVIRTRSSRRITALDTIKSNLRWHSPESPCWNVTLSSPMADDISEATFIFFAMRSIRWNRHSGHNMASGIPGNPPPVPRSMNSVPALGCRNFAIDRECNIWWTYRLSISRREITFIFRSIQGTASRWRQTAPFVVPTSPENTWL